MTRYGASGTKSQQKYTFSFDKTFLNLTVNYLLNNCYFTLGSMCFHPLVGIFIGSHPAPFMTKLFFLLSLKEVVFQKEKADPTKGPSIFSFFRFIDDLCTFSNNEFEYNYNDIYLK